MAAVDGVAQPLHGGDTDCAVKDTGSERNALPHVAHDDVPCCLALRRNVEHIRAHVQPNPRVPRLGERRAAQAAPAAHVEDEARALRRQREQLQRAHRQLVLDFADPRVAIVLPRLLPIVENGGVTRVLGTPLPSHRERVERRVEAGDF